MSDTGCGMSPEVLERIFEPFFTTKGTGQGTGLGLAMVFGIVQQSGGCIHVYSEPGQGTTFKIYFPSVQEAETARAPSAEKAARRGSETILLVEDEAGVRGLAQRCLELHNYRVLPASDGRDALEVLKHHGGPLDLLLSDVVMPQQSGPELAEALSVRFPQMKVLFMSGYTDDAVVRHGLLAAEVAFIQKPFSPTALAQKVREVLDEK
jgi:CheY-like chemotaxis protein